MGDQLQCADHYSPILYICTLSTCSISNLLCNLCLKHNQSHLHEHHKHIVQLSDFSQTNPSIDQKYLISLLLGQLDNIEKQMSKVTIQTDNVKKQLEEDFAAFYQQFYLIADQSKKHIYNVYSKPDEVALNVQKLKKNIIDYQKQNQSFFQNLVKKDLKKLTVENIKKILKEYQTLYQLRAQFIELQPQVEKTLEEQPKFFKNLQQMEEIKLQYQSSIKETFQQYTSITNGTYVPKIQQSLSQSQSQIIPQQIKKLDQIPKIQNKTILGILQKLERVRLTMDDQFRNVPETGPIQFIPSMLVYQGQIKDGKKHGRGVLIFPDESVYEGLFFEDRLQGYGRFVRNNGCIYEGHCLDSKADGKGLYLQYDGYKYQGEWKQDLKQGLGEEYFPSGIEVKGTYYQNQLHGQGLIKFPDKTVFKGDFKNGVLEGPVTIDYPNGDKYIGSIIDGQKCGSSVYRYNDGRYYEGQFQNNLPNGYGIFYYTDGVVFKGNWKDGLEHGVGVQIVDGKEWKGEWINGNFDRWI